MQAERQAGGLDIDGILLVDKPEGISSARALALVRHALGRPKAGHLGTLDPLASGLLPLCVGQGTKIARYLADNDKAYSGLIRLGLRTDTLDVTGKTVDRAEAPEPGCLDLEGLARSFTGSFEQRPPVFSAIKRGGVPLYKLARRGLALEPGPRPVTISVLRLWAAGPGLLGFEVDCSKGTYVRSLARDIGEEIGCGGALEQLRRTRFGRFSLEDAVTVDEIGGGGPEVVERALVPLLTVLGGAAGMAMLAVGAAGAAALRQGRQEALCNLEAPGAPGDTACVVVEGQAAAIVREHEGAWRLERVFVADRRAILRPQ